MPRDLLAGKTAAPAGPRDLLAPKAAPSVMDQLQAEISRIYGNQDTAAPEVQRKAFQQGVNEGVPILGPLVQNAADFVGSNIASKITGRPADELAAEAKAKAEAGLEGAGQARGIGNVASGLATLGGVGLNGTLWQQALKGLGVGGAVTGADALARGDSLGDAAMKGGVGVVAGATLPFVSAGMGGILKAILSDKDSKVATTLANALRRDRVPATAIKNMLEELGPDAVIADLGPNLTRQAAAIASLPGEGQTVVREAMVNRMQGRNPRIQGDVDNILGEAPVPAQIGATIRDGQTALSPEYQEAFRGAQPVDTAALAGQLDSMAQNLRGPAQSAAKKVRDMLNFTAPAGDGLPATTILDTNPGTLFEVRNAIDGMIATETDPKASGILKYLRGQVDDTLAAAVPGIKEVDAKFAELARQNEGLQTGSTVLDSGKTAPRPTEVSTIMQQGAQPEGLFIGPSGTAFRVSQGARAEIDRIIGTTANNLTALKSALKGDGSWNRQRLAEVFGQDKAGSLLNVLERETAYQRTYDAVMSNSETAARAAAQKDVAPHEFNGNQTSLVGLFMAAPQKAANAIAKMRGEDLNRVLAQQLTSKGDPALLGVIAQEMRKRNLAIPPAAAAFLLTSQGA